MIRRLILIILLSASLSLELMIPLFLLFFLLFFVSRVIGVRSGHFRRRASRGRRDPLDVGGCQAATQGIDEDVVAHHLMIM